MVAGDDPVCQGGQFPGPPAEFAGCGRGVGGQFGGPLMGSFEAEHGRERDFPAVGILAHPLADGSLISFGVEQVVGDLEGHSKGSPEAFEHRQVRWARVDRDPTEFERGPEQVHVFRSHPLSSLLGSGGQRTLVVAVEALSPETPVVVTDRLGRSRTLAVRDGKAEIPLASELAYVSGARALTVTHVQTGVGPGWVVEAEDCRHSPGWITVERAGFSNGRTLDIWSDAEPGPEGYWVELPLTVPTPGRYEVLFAGNALTRLAPPRSLSPLAWRVDQGAEHVLDDATPMAVDIAGTPEGVSILGDVQLEAGTHIFRLRLTGRRDESDTHYALWFDALALRPLPSEPTPPGQP